MTANSTTKRWAGDHCIERGSGRGALHGGTGLAFPHYALLLGNILREPGTKAACDGTIASSARGDERVKGLWSECIPRLSQLTGMTETTKIVSNALAPL
jgi:hypothetical protein